MRTNAIAIALVIETGMAESAPRAIRAGVQLSRIAAIAVGIRIDNGSGPAVAVAKTARAGPTGATVVLEPSVAKMVVIGTVNVSVSPAIVSMIASATVTETVIVTEVVPETPVPAEPVLEEPAPAGHVVTIAAQMTALLHHAVVSETAAIVEVQKAEAEVAEALVKAQTQRRIIVAEPGRSLVRPTVAGSERHPVEVVAAAAMTVGREIAGNTETDQATETAVATVTAVKCDVGLTEKAAAKEKVQMVAAAVVALLETFLFVSYGSLTNAAKVTPAESAIQDQANAKYCWPRCGIRTAVLALNARDGNAYLGTRRGTLVRDIPGKQGPITVIKQARRNIDDMPTILA